MQRGEVRNHLPLGDITARIVGSGLLPHRFQRGPENRLPSVVDVLHVDVLLVGLEQSFVERLGGDLLDEGEEVIAVDLVTPGCLCSSHSPEEGKGLGETRVKRFVACALAERIQDHKV